MHRIRLEIWLATTAIVVVAGGICVPGVAAPVTEAEIAAAVPMPEAANLPPPTLADLGLPAATQRSLVSLPSNGIAPASASPAAASPASVTPAAAASTPPAVSPASASAPAPAAPENAAAPQPTPPNAEAPAIASQLSSVDQPIAEKLRDLFAGKIDRILDRKIKSGVEAFYTAHGFAPIWIESGAETTRAKAAVSYLATTDADGLDPSDYQAPSFSNSDSAALAEAELKFTAMILTYARNAQLGRVHYSRVSADIVYDQVAPEPAAVLGDLLDAKDVAATLDSYNPPQPGYKALRAKLAELRGGGSGAKRISVGATLKVGMQDARVPTLRSRLSVTGEGGDETYDKTLSEAVKNFQHQRGLPQTGILNNATVETLNGGSGRHEHEIEIIVANMERWRWMPRDLGKAYVMVNIPDYVLKVIDRGNVVWSTRIVVGKPGEKATPLLSETMKYITVNPTWNVPPSIVNNEYLPALAQDPLALERIGLKMDRNRDGSVHIYQPPGEGNALGRIRFNFPNKFLVYQHDTPDKYMFALNQRAYSHGCMRVQYPDKYAEVLLNISNPKDGYSAERIRRMYGTGERDIQLNTPIPVHLTYQTAFVDDAGNLAMRDDIYGRDSRLVAALKNDDRRFADVPVEHREANAAPRRQAAARMPVQQPTGAGFSFFGFFR